MRKYLVGDIIKPKNNSAWDFQKSLVLENNFRYSYKDDDKTKQGLFIKMYIFKN